MLRVILITSLFLPLLACDTLPQSQQTAEEIERFDEDLVWVDNPHVEHEFKMTVVSDKENDTMLFTGRSGDLVPLNYSGEGGIEFMRAPFSGAVMLQINSTPNHTITATMQVGDGPVRTVTATGYSVETIISWLPREDSSRIRYTIASDPGMNGLTTYNVPGENEVARKSVNKLSADGSLYHVEEMMVPRDFEAGVTIPRNSEGCVSMTLERFIGDEWIMVHQKGHCNYSGVFSHSYKIDSNSTMMGRTY